MMEINSNLKTGLERKKQKVNQIERQDIKNITNSSGFLVTKCYIIKYMPPMIEMAPLESLRYFTVLSSTTFHGSSQIPVVFALCIY